MKMRIILIISSLTSGGAERVIVMLADYLAVKGYEVTLVTFGNNKTKPFYSVNPLVRLIQLDIAGTSENYARGYLNNVKRLGAIRKTFKEIKPQVIISFLNVINILAVLAAFGLRIPVIVSERSVPSCEGLGSVWKILRRFAYPLAAHLVVQTEGVLGYFSARVKRKALVIPNPVKPPDSTTTVRSARINGSSRTIIAVGRLRKLKGFDLLIKAFAMIAAKYPQWKLVIWGEGSMRSELESLVNKAGLHGRVNLPGRTSDIYSKLVKADLFVMPSLYEGFPNALCEAMACGLPVIASDCPGGISEIVRDGTDGILVKPGKAEALSEAMDYLMDDEEARIRLSANAPGIIERFSVEKVMKMWEEAIWSTQLPHIQRR